MKNNSGLSGKPSKARLATIEKEISQLLKPPKAPRQHMNANGFENERLSRLKNAMNDFASFTSNGGIGKGNAKLTRGKSDSLSQKLIASAITEVMNKARQEVKTNN